MSTTTTKLNVQLTARPNHERGHADHGWLKTFHTFSFAECIQPSYSIDMVSDVHLDSYFDANFAKWGSLRVINEDRVQPGTGYVNRSSFYSP